LKQIIINADDFGRHVLINRAVETAVQEGMLRSATIMAGGAAFADAAELAVRTPALGVGIHLTLVDAAPVLPPEKLHLPYIPPDALHHRAILAKIIRPAAVWSAEVTSTETTSFMQRNPPSTTIIVPSSR